MVAAFGGRIVAARVGVVAIDFMIVNFMIATFMIMGELRPEVLCFDKLSGRRQLVVEIMVRVGLGRIGCLFRRLYGRAANVGARSLPGGAELAARDAFVNRLRS